MFETLRDCLTEALDAEGMVGVLEAIESGEIEVFGKDTLQPSAFSHQLLNAMPYAFLDDAPLEERRARAVTLRRALPEDSRDLGALSPDAIAEEEGVRLARDTRRRRVARRTAVAGRADRGRPHGAPGRCRVVARVVRVALAEAGRVQTLEAPRLPSPGVPSPSPSPLVGRGDQAGLVLWYAVERADVVRAAYEDGDAEAVAEIVRGRAESSGPFTVSGLAQRLALSESAVSQAAIRLESEGALLRGRFRPGAAGRGVLRPPDTRAHPPEHDRAAAARDRAGAGRELHPLPAGVAACHAGDAPRGRRGFDRGRRAVAGVRGGSGGVGERPADEPPVRLPRLDARRSDARWGVGVGAVRHGAPDRRRRRPCRATGR